MQSTRVIFRAERSGEFKNDVTAVLPDEPSNYGMCSCYAHIGQHSECAREWYDQTRPATRAEYAALLAEMTAIYGAEPDPVVLRVARRVPNAAWRKSE